jgi:hypothetical protein
MGAGIFRTSEPRAGHNPVITIKMLETIKAPTANSKLRPRPALAAKKAAPGVLQTTLIGILSQALSAIDITPYPTNMTARAVEICEFEAPMAARPAIAIAKVATEPVIDATVPATKGAKRSELRLIFLPRRSCL